MEDKDTIEEAHGLWELAIVRLATMVEVLNPPARVIDDAVAEERKAFKHWQDVSNALTKQRSES